MTSLESVLLVLASSLASGSAVGLWLARRNRPPEAGNNALQLLQGQVAQLSAQLNERMQETSNTLHTTQSAVGQRLDHAASMVALVERKLGALEESSRRIHALGEGLQELRDVLKSPKLRGNMGEFFLEDLLRQILPADHFAMQVPFRTGDVVDAAIRVGDSLVCVDSKFPLESFTRLSLVPESDEPGRRAARKAFCHAIQRHADSISKKYILPDEGTFDFALMYIPAENVYYETIVRSAGEEEAGLQEYLLSRRVIPVSPGSLYAYLQVIVLGLRGLKVEEHARRLAQDLNRLSGELERFRADYSVLGRHLRNAGGAYEEGGRRLEKFESRLGTLAAPESNERPETEGPHA